MLSLTLLAALVLLPGDLQAAQEERSQEAAHEETEGEADGDSSAWGATFLIRVGAGYNIGIGDRYSFSPSIAFDFIGREQALVYGADFSIKF